jgi:bisphosphoglycerate-dependent phosphoglycerate mutase
VCAVQVEPLLKAGKNVLISAHGNSLRAIIMYLDSLTSEQVRACTQGFPMAYTKRAQQSWIPLPTVGCAV